METIWITGDFRTINLTFRRCMLPWNQLITSHVATIFCNHLAKFMLPKRRFWKPEKHFGPPVWALFQGCEPPHRTLPAAQRCAAAARRTPAVARDRELLEGWARHWICNRGRSFMITGLILPAGSMYSWCRQTRFGRLLLENVLKTMVQNAFRVSKIFVWGA
jgi:hypothetical protein